jgi:hypothetical protein
LVISPKDYSTKYRYWREALSLYHQFFIEWMLFMMWTFSCVYTVCRNVRHLMLLDNRILPSRALIRNAQQFVCYC